MTVRADQLMYEHLADWLGPRTRCFFDGQEGEFADGKWAAKKLDGLELLDSSSGQSIWTLTFKYAGYIFMIDCNQHGNSALYFVNDPACPDEILLDVIRHFDRHRHRPDWTLLIVVVLAIATVLAVLVFALVRDRP
jgi:hypothetical protein